MRKTDSKLLKTIRSELQKIADRERAAQMQAYMKSEMPYHGVPAPLVKKTCRHVFSTLEFSTFEAWQANVLDLWRQAQFREERYAALNLAGYSRAKPYQRFEAMPMYEEMIVTGAWWDYVDDLATHRVGYLLEIDPKPVKRLMLQWAKSSNIWKRRTSILCQIGAKDQTDLQFLYKCIAPSMAADEFFLRKAIGWALRQVAWRDPAEVIRYVKANRDSLSPLSKREALKNLLKAGKTKQIP